jgi:DNA-binding NarL/FixJ family response regulator
MREDPHLEVLLPAARAILTFGTDEREKESVRAELHVLQATAVQRTMDDEIRVRWLRGPIGSQLAELAGPIDEPLPTARDDGAPAFDDNERRLLRLLTEGKTNSEIASNLDLDESAVTSQLAALYARIGTGSRAEATAFAFRAV